MRQAGLIAIKEEELGTSTGALAMPLVQREKSKKWCILVHDLWKSFWKCATYGGAF